MHFKEYFCLKIYVIMSGLRGSHKAICFTERCLIFIFCFVRFFVLNGWANGSRKRLETDEKFQRILNPLRGDHTSLSFYPKIVLPSPTFSNVVENTYWQFSRKLFNQFENCLRIMITVPDFCKKCAARMAIAAQLSLHFPCGKCVTWKNWKKRWISTTSLNRFSSSFHQNDRNSVTI